jgi:hypothetical protein
LRRVPVVGAHDQVVVRKPPCDVAGIFDFERRRAGVQVDSPHVHQLAIADVEQRQNLAGPTGACDDVMASRALPRRQIANIAAYQVYRQ